MCSGVDHDNRLKVSLMLYNINVDLLIVSFVFKEVLINSKDLVYHHL